MRCVIKEINKVLRVKLAGEPQRAIVSRNLCTYICAAVNKAWPDI